MFSKILKRHLNSRIGEFITLIFGVIIYCFIAVIDISKVSLWLDEAFTAYLTKYNYIDILRYTAADVHPPLYYWLVKPWLTLFGYSELGLRSFSIFFGALSIIIGYLLVKKLFTKYIAQISMAFMVLSPLFLRYSRDARMYTLMTFIALAATYMLVKAVKSNKKPDWLSYGLLVGLGMLTHYFTAIVWLAHWLWRTDIIFRNKSKTKFIKTFFSKGWIFAHVIALLVFLAWLPVFVYQYTNIQGGGFWIPDVSINSLASYATNVVYYLNANETTGWLALLFVSTLTTLYFLARKVYFSLNKSEQDSYRLIIAIAFLPMVTLFLISMPPMRSLFIDRYLVISALFSSIFIGINIAIGAKLINKKIYYALLFAVLTMMMMGVGNVWRSGNLNKITNSVSQSKEIMHIIGQDNGGWTPVITESPWLFYETVYYETEKNPVYFIDEKTSYTISSLDMLKYSDKHKIKNINTFTSNHPVVWYVTKISEATKYEAPYSEWKIIKEVVVNDSLSGKPNYRLYKYVTN